MHPVGRVDIYHTALPSSLSFVCCSLSLHTLSHCGAVLTQSLLWCLQRRLLLRPPPRLLLR